MNMAYLFNEDIEGEGIPVDSQEAAEAVGEAVTVADESAAVQAEGSEIETTAAEVPEAIQAGEELEEIADVAEEAVESGDGLTEREAEITNIAVENILGRIGMPHKLRRTAIKIESFSRSGTRLAATKALVEGLGEGIKKVWENIVRFFKTIWATISGWFNKIFDNSKRLLERLRALKKQLIDLGPIKDSSKKTIDDSSTISYLNIREGVKNASDEFDKKAKDLNDYKTLLGTFKKTMQGAVTKEDPSRSLDDAYKAISGKAYPKLGNYESSIKEKAKTGLTEGNDTDATIVAQLSGYRALVIVKTHKKDDNGAPDTNRDPSILFKTVPFEKYSGKELNLESGPKFEEVLDLAIKQVEGLSDYKREFEKAKELIDSAKRTAEETLASLASKDKADREVQKKRRDALKFISSGISNLYTPFASEILKFGQTADTWVRKQIIHFEFKK
jgi:hypothetical protein